MQIKWDFIEEKLPKITNTSEDNHAISNANDLNVRRIP